MVTYCDVWDKENDVQLNGLLKMMLLIIADSGQTTTTIDGVDWVHLWSTQYSSWVVPWLYSRKIWRSDIWQWTTRGWWWVTPTESGLLSKSTTYIRTITIYAKFTCVTYVLFQWANVLISSIKNSNFIQFISCGYNNKVAPAELFLVAKGTPVCAPLWCHRCYCCSIVMS